MNKKILSIISGVALVSVATVGFSSWVVGLQQKEATSEVTVNVDTVINDTQYITAELASNEIVVAEKTKYTRTGNDIIGTNDDSSEAGVLSVNENALGFSFTDISITLGDDAANEESKKVTGVNISLPIDETYNKFLIPEKDYLDTEKDVSQLSYLSFEETLTLADDFSTPTSNAGYKIYNLKKENSSFVLNWGSFFGGHNPVTYYNGLYKTGDTISDLLTRSNNAYAQLKAMHDSLNGQTLTFVLSLVYGD